ncbi:hypothetical protein AVEN_109605-1, partial [Araneus ventricosus]
MKIDIEYNKHGGDLGFPFETSGIEVASSLCWGVRALIKLRSEFSRSRVMRTVAIDGIPI